MIQDEPYLPGMPIFLPFEVGRRRDPRRRLGEHDRGELAVDRRDVLDRDALADGRDHARPVGDADVDLALADLRHEVRVDLVLERDVEPGRPRSSRPGRRGRTGRTGRSGCSRGRPSASTAGGRRRRRATAPAPMRRRARGERRATRTRRRRRNERSRATGACDLQAVATERRRAGVRGRRRRDRGRSRAGRS